VAASKPSFPREFLWGAATASHQVEGGNCWNDWWEHEQAGRLPFRSDRSCGHYELFEQDFELARTLGHNCHRFSIEWSRIEPSPGAWDEGALGHYRDVVRALRARALEPVVTLHHFTNPAWFARAGGWKRAGSSREFARFVERVVAALGREVRYWITVNEPVVLAIQGYVNGKWPPLEHGAWLAAFRVLRNLARAHRAAREVIKRAFPEAQVGFAHNALPTFPCDPRRARDVFAARIWDYCRNGLFPRLLGLRRDAGDANLRRVDFIGINYYTRSFVSTRGVGLGALLGRACKRRHHAGEGAFSMMEWEVFPQGLKLVLERNAAYGVPLFVTENGIATDDDALRREFLERHLEVLGDSIRAGVRVLGYLYWSLMDNFEWAHGTHPRFGLAAVDYATLERVPRPSAEVLRRFATTARGGDHGDHRRA
jgi:beta-glucosidase